MAFNRPSRNVLAMFGVITVVVLVGNFWISRELNKLEKSSVLTPYTPVTDSVEEQKPVYGIVKIDPANDPLAPVVASAPVPTRVANPKPSEPVHEAHINSPILAQ